MEEAHYNIILISQHVNLCLSTLCILELYYFNITIEDNQYLDWRVRLFFFVLVDCLRMALLCRNVWSLIIVLLCVLWFIFYGVNLLVDIFNNIVMKGTISSLKTGRPPNTSL